MVEFGPRVKFVAPTDWISVPANCAVVGKFYKTSRGRVVKVLDESDVDPAAPKKYVALEAYDAAGQYVTDLQVPANYELYSPPDGQNLGGLVTKIDRSIAEKIKQIIEESWVIKCYFCGRKGSDYVGAGTRDSNGRVSDIVYACRDCARDHPDMLGDRRKSAHAVEAIKKLVEEALDG